MEEGYRAGAGHRRHKVFVMPTGFRGQQKLPANRSLEQIEGATEAYSGQVRQPHWLPGFHLILQPILGFCSAEGTRPSAKSWMAAASEAPVTGLPFDGRLSSN